MKKLFSLLLCFIFFMIFTIPIFAHGGRTDAQGGHNDNINGGYHYHHGFEAHDHHGGECPYFSDETAESKNSFDESNESNTTTEETFEIPPMPDLDFTFDEDILNPNIDESYESNFTNESHDITDSNNKTEDHIIWDIFKWVAIVIAIIIIIILFRKFRKS